MAFTLEKFTQLKPSTRAKKCSDMLRELLLQPGKDWKVKLREYHQLAFWFCSLDTSEDSTPILPKVAPETLWSRELVLAYEFWRKISGLGLEERVYSVMNFTDDTQDKADRIPWIVWCHNLRSAHNVGSIIRSADCFGFCEVWISGYTADAANKSLKAASMGSEAWMKIRYFESTDAVLSEIKDLKKTNSAKKSTGQSSEGNLYKLWALETAPDAPYLHEAHFPQQGILLLGNEEFGISEELLEACEEFIQIPMYGRKTSLNVSNAFAVCAHQIRVNTAP